MNQPVVIQALLSKKYTDREINDEFGFTGEWRLSLKDIVDIFIDTNKPNWSDAPEWANYLTLDEKGYWEWHEKEPEVIECDQLINNWNSIGKHKIACSAKDELKESRPIKKD